MKRTLAAVLAGAMVISLAGCGSTSNSETPGISSEAAESGAAEQSANVNDTTDTKSQSVTQPEFDQSAVIEETVLIDQDNVKVTATELSYTDYSADVSLLIENNSDRDLDFISESLGYACNSVNRYMISDGFMNETVAAGKKINHRLSFDYDHLEAYGITQIAEMEIGIYTSDSDHNYTYYEPKKIVTDKADGYDFDTDSYQSSISDGILEALADCSVDYFNTDSKFDLNGVSMISSGLVTDSYGDPNVFFEFKNTSDQNLYTEISQVAVNGLVVYGGDWSKDALNASTIAVAQIDINSLFDQIYQEGIQLGSINSIGFNLSLQDAEGNDLTEPQWVSVPMSNTVTEYAVTGNALLESSGITVTEIGSVSDEDSDLHLFYAVKNDTAAAIAPECDYNSLSINGFMVDFYDFAGIIPAGMTGLLRIDIDQEDLESAGISSSDDITEIEYKFTAMDEEYNDVVNEKITATK